VVVPEDVQAFAREQGVEAYLPAVLQTARQVFPEALVEIGLDPDPEIEEMCHLLVTVQGARRTVEQALQAEDEYQRRLFALIPSTVIWHFRCRLRLAA
jgi:hypothetical protein